MILTKVTERLKCGCLSIISEPHGTQCMGGGLTLTDTCAVCQDPWLQRTNCAPIAVCKNHFQHVAGT